MNVGTWALPTVLDATEIYWQTAGGGGWGGEGIRTTSSLTLGWDRGRKLCFHEKQFRSQFWQKPELC